MVNVISKGFSLIDPSPSKAPFKNSFIVLSSYFNILSDSGKIVDLFPLGTPVKVIEDDLKANLESLAKTMFGDVEMRWMDTYFPFTTPSFELEILFRGEWLEVLGCGVIQQDIIRSAGRGEQPGWAFGLGLERLAMVLFQIPDIRLFWSKDERFIKQFQSGEIDTKFQPYSKYPDCYKDVSFWTGTKENPISSFHMNDFCEIVRGLSPANEDIIEKIEVIDEFTHPKTQQNSICARITYRSMDRSLTNEEVDAIQLKVREKIVEELKVVLR